MLARLSQEVDPTRGISKTALFEGPSFYTQEGFTVPRGEKLPESNSSRVATK